MTHFKEDIVEGKRFSCSCGNKIITTGFKERRNNFIGNKPQAHCNISA
jgi:hypothetical protein